MSLLTGMDYRGVLDLNKSLEASGSISLLSNGMMKSLNTGEGTGSDMTDLDTLQDGRAITIENIDSTLKLSAETEDDLVWYHLLRTQDIHAVLDQWMEQSDHGDNNGRHSFNIFQTETELPAEVNVQLNRRVDVTKFLRTVGSVSHPMGEVTAMVDPNFITNRAGAIRILKAQEKATVFGNKDFMPTQYDGFMKKLRDAYDAGSTNAFVDCRATGSGSASSGGELTESLLDTGSRNIKNNHGRASDMVMPLNVKSDLDQILTLGRRAVLPAVQDVAKLLLGVPVDGYRSSHAYKKQINFHDQIDTFYPDGESESMKAPTVAIPSTAAAPTAPTGVTAAVTTDSDSLFSTGDNGNYWYKVSAVTSKGETIATAVAGATAVAVGEKVTLSITCNDSTITGLSIYRSELDASDASDCRWIADIECTAPQGVTTFEDLNLILPGTTTAVMISNAPNTDAVDYRQLMPFVRIPLAFAITGSVTYPYLYMLYCYLRTPKLVSRVVGGTYHVLYTNIRTSESDFGVAA